ncbi:MAG: hypothetical protein J6Z34_04020 [Clostridia bacterium]|nr:hypothetical protein [Clostridia bacterium]
MFGYVRTDDPYLYKKDDVLYGAVYCGLCKSIGKLCGQIARFGLTYDVAFLSVLLHNLADTDVKIKKQRCAAHWFKRRNIAVPDNISEQMAAVNVILCYYKAVDDRADTGKKNLKSAVFSKGYRRAVKKYPQFGKAVEKCYLSLSALEKNECPSPDMAADPFSVLAAEIAREVLGGKFDENVKDIFYFLGKWIYLLDALDDFDKDRKSGNYNVFALAYPDAHDGKQLLRLHRDEVFGFFNSAFFRLKKGYENAKFYFNKDLAENVLIRGIPKRTDAVAKKYLTD